jgi:TRAP-type C4-dicarboxylate transport system permease small subunit
MGKFWAVVSKFIGRFYVWFIYISVAGLTLMTAIQVSLRFIPGVKLYGTAELITLSAVWMYFLGMGYVSYRNKHITADVLSWLFPEDNLVAKWLGLLGSFLGIVVCIFYGILAFQFIVLVASMGQVTTDIGYPRVLQVSSVGVGFLVMSLFSVFHFAKEVAALRRFHQEKRTR